MNKIEKIKEINEKLKAIRGELDVVVAMYNFLSPEKKLKIEETDESIRDIKNVYVCLYDEDLVGLFEQICWSTEKESKDGSEMDFDAGIIYKRIDTEYIGMKTTHSNVFSFSMCEPSGVIKKVNGTTYISNCSIKDCMSFDDMRLNMAKADENYKYRIGKATEKDMLDVVRYAKSFYLSHERSSQRRKRLLINDRDKDIKMSFN